MRSRTVRQRFTGLSTVALAACLGVGLLTAPSRAAEHRPPPPATVGATAAAGQRVDPAVPDPAVADPGGPAAQPLTAPVQDGGHIGGTAMKPADRAPQTASSDALKRDYDDPRAAAPSHPAPSMRTKARTAAKAAGLAPTAGCSVADFTTRTGSALVQQVTSSTTDCVNTLFRIKGNDGYLAFREAQMVTVAHALHDRSAAYPGDSSTGMPQLVLFLRAGYYVQYYDPGTVGSYGDPLRTAVQAGLDAFFASAHARDVTDANGETLAEAVTLIDSAGQNARYLYVVKRLLAGYDSSYDRFWYMLNAVNNVYTVTFRGHQLPAFVSAVQAEPSLLDSLAGFARDHFGLLGTDRSYLTSNAGRELGRFLQEEPLRPRARPLVVDLLGGSSLTGPTAPLWVSLAEMTDAYDRANCTMYHTCDLAARIKSAVLPVEYTCTAGIRILAQQMSSADLTAACTSLRGQDAYFHAVARDSGPVADDRNATIEVVVFDSSTDYRTYAGVMYGIDTDNGGMYLEGDPSAAGNQPRFIAYEAEWVRPDFQIWNLNHEYTHYLDGRFDMAGDFQAGVRTPTIWWVEGFAEYVSYSYRDVTYDDAIAQAAAHTYTLSSLFDTTYENADQTRIYNWGYLAVLYMLRSHRAEVDGLLNLYRGGDWSGARTLLTSTIGSRYDSDWNAWLTACAAGSCGTTDPPAEPSAECTASDVRELGENCARNGQQATRGNYSYLYLYVPAGTTRLKITTSGGTGDADLYYHANGWATTGAYTSRATGSGNTHTLTVDNPAEGAHYISLYAVRDFGGVKVSTQY
ncbi:M9 family metallopeptidase [Streptomyces sp. NPDC005426]|uniref:M9 family metallopeptidase n=1 Tax=Streptomyces sp. NPDC005426 TaxID=3155344 RepID=UPI0033AA3537